MMKISQRLLAVAASAALVMGIMAGCSQQTDTNTEPEEDVTPVEEVVTERTFTDMAGNTVTVSADKTGIITPNSVATQMVLMMGGEEAAATLGQGFGYTETDLNYKMFANLGNVPNFTRDDVTVENCAALDPMLVIIDRAEVVDTLTAAGIPAAMMSVTDAESLMAACEMLGQALGGDAIQKAADYRAFYTDIINTVESKSANLTDEEKITVMYMRSETTVVATGGMPEMWIESIGGINIAKDVLGLTGVRAEINIETLLAQNPDVIVCERTELAETLLSDPQYAELDAVKNGKVFAAPFGTAVWSMGTAEATLFLPWIAMNANPEVYGTDLYNMDALTTEFFQKFYGYTLTADDLNTIFHR